MRLTFEAAAELIRRGGVVAYPTETVYGLGCDVRSDAALAALRALKGRSRERGVSVLLADPELLWQLETDLPEHAATLARAFWPGPLTLVIAAAAASYPLVATDYGVAFRCSPHPQAAELARRAGVPLASTSANLSGAEPARTADEVEAIFGAGFPIAGGAPAGGASPSTVVAVDTAGDLELLRAGAIPFDEIRASVSGQELLEVRM